MKEKRENKPRLNKTTIQDLDTGLDRDEQKRIKGGSESHQSRNTQIPIFC